jgi:hypothetical protein
MMADMPNLAAKFSFANEYVKKHQPVFKFSLSTIRIRSDTFSIEIFECVNGKTQMRTKEGKKNLLNQKEKISMTSLTVV